MTRIAFALSLVFAAACGPDAPDTGGDVRCGANLLVGDLVITEVHANPAGPDGGSGGEFWEFFNATSGTVDLTGVVLEYEHEDDLRQHTMRDVTIQSGQYFVVAGVLDEFRQPYMDYGYGSDLGDLRNAGATLRITCDGDEIDTVDYPDQSASSFDGVSAILDGNTAPDHILNDNPMNFCAATEMFAPGQLGSPGEANEGCVIIVEGQCNDGENMRDTVDPQPGDLVITEFMANPAAASDTDAEWFELYAVNQVDLNGLIVGSTAGASIDRDEINSPDCLTFGPDQYILFAKSADTMENGNLQGVNFVHGFSMSQTNGSNDDILVEFPEGTVLDTVVYDGGVVSSGVSRQLDPAVTINTTNNDDQLNFCDGASDLGNGDQGTPGAANDCIGGSDMCNDNGTDRPIDPAGPGDITITEYLPDSTNPASDTLTEWIEIRVERALDLNGLQFRDNTGSLGEFTVDSPDCLQFAAGTLVLFGHSNDPLMNGGLPTVDFLLPGGTLISLNQAADEIHVGTNGVDIDSVSYTDADYAPGEAIQLDGDGQFCPAQTAYGDGNLGTPRAANDVDCP